MRGALTGAGLLAALGAVVLGVLALAGSLPPGPAVLCALGAGALGLARTRA